MSLSYTYILTSSYLATVAEAQAENGINPSPQRLGNPSDDAAGKIQSMI